MSRDRLYVDKKQDIFIKEWALDAKNYNFKEASNKSIFLLAVVKGFEYYDPSITIDRREGGYVRTEYLSHEDKALLFALFLAKGGPIHSLLNVDEVYDFAEKCAFTGFKIIKQELDTSSESELFELRKVKELNNIYAEFKKA